MPRSRNRLPPRAAARSRRRFSKSVRICNPATPAVPRRRSPRFSKKCTAITTITMVAARSRKLPTAAHQRRPRHRRKALHQRPTRSTSPPERCPRRLCFLIVPRPVHRAARAKFFSSSKRNLVVHVARLARAGQRRLALARHARAAGAEVIAAVGTGAAAAGIEHGELRIEALQNHFGRVAVVAVLVLPFARLQRAFQVNLRALLEILLDDLAQALVEDHLVDATCHDALRVAICGRATSLPVAAARR